MKIWTRLAIFISTAGPDQTGNSDNQTGLDRMFTIYAQIYEQMRPSRLYMDSARLGQSPWGKQLRSKENMANTLVL